MHLSISRTNLDTRCCALFTSFSPCESILANLRLSYLVVSARTASFASLRDLSLSSKRLLSSAFSFRSLSQSRTICLTRVSKLVSIFCCSSVIFPPICQQKYVLVYRDANFGCLFWTFLKKGITAAAAYQASTDSSMRRTSTLSMRAASMSMISISKSFQRSFSVSAGMRSRISSIKPLSVL